MNKLPKKYMFSYKAPKFDLDKKLEILSEFPVFKNVGIDEIALFAKRVNPKIIRPMEVFVEQELDHHEAFFVHKGAVSLFRATDEGEIINIDLVGAPELIGTEGLIQTEPSPTSVMALVETHAFVLHQEDFKEILEENALLAMPFLKLLARRVTGFDLFLEHLLSNNLYLRTWKMLQVIAPYFPNKEITLSQEELADLIWGTRSRVTEVLNKLEAEGLIKISHRKVKVL